MKSLPMTNIGRAVAVTMALTGLLHAGIASAAGAADTANAAPAALAADDQGLSLIVTYQTTPANRSTLQHELAQSTARELAQWKHDGRLAQYNLLFNRYADSGNWDAMAILTFATPADLYRWRKVEATHPGALSVKALAVTTSIRTAPVDLKRADATATGAPDSVYVAIPYKTEVSASDYRKYADAYVIPQFKGWMDEGVLAGYSIYMSQFPAAREWDVIAILQYKDETALSEREAIVGKVRERLKSNPEWKAISDSKQHVRAEGQVVVADPVVAGR
jgi:hypothetical protein